jgi:hypothetical protein
MVKTMALVCAGMLTFSVSGLGLKAGWFGGKSQASTEARHVQGGDPMNSEAAMRYRNCLQTSWRLALTVR